MARRAPPEPDRSPESDCLRATVCLGAAITFYTRALGTQFAIRALRLSADMLEKRLQSEPGE